MEGDLHLIQLLSCVLITSDSCSALKNVHPLVKQLLLFSFSSSSVFQEANTAPESLGDLFSVRGESLHVAFLCNYLGVSVFAFYRIPEENSIPAFLLLHFSPKLDIAPKTWICVQLQHTWSHRSKVQEEELKLQQKVAFFSPSRCTCWSWLWGWIPMDVGGVHSPPLASRALWLWQSNEIWMDGQDICVTFPSWESFSVNSLPSLGAVLSFGMHLGWKINLC